VQKFKVMEGETNQVAEQIARPGRAGRLEFPSALLLPGNRSKNESRISISLKMMSDSPKVIVAN